MNKKYVTTSKLNLNYNKSPKCWNIIPDEHTLYVLHILKHKGILKTDLSEFEILEQLKYEEKENE